MMKRSLSIIAFVALAGASLAADVLHLRDGRRVRGELVGYSNGTIEWREEGGGFFGGRVVRVDRDDVVRIDFDDVSDRGGSAFDADARPRGLREREVGVDARTAWTDTGIDLQGIQTVYFEAEGRVTWGPGRRDGPKGENNSPRNDGRPMPSRPAAALIGRVGESNDVFLIGDETGPVRIPTSGRLYLGINDDFLTDNSGSFRVTVYY